MSKKKKLEKVDSNAMSVERFLNQPPPTRLDTFIWWIRYGIWRKLNDLRYIPNEIGYFFQRGILGWSKKDTWNLDVYLSRVILDCLVEFQCVEYGYSRTFNPATGKWSYNKKRWKKILNDMICGFALLRKCQIGEELQWGGSLTEKEKLKSFSDSRWKKHGIPRFITRVEEEKIKHAFDLLRDNFWNLSC